MAHINSAEILVFPAVGRTAEVGASGQYMTEYNLVNIINRLTDQAAFVISGTNGTTADPESPATFNENLPLEFNMYGYYFRISSTGLSSILSGSTTANPYLTATITLSYNSTSGATTIKPNDARISLNNSIDSGTKPNWVYTGLSLAWSAAFSAPVPNSTVAADLFEKGTYTLKLTLLKKSGSVYQIPASSRVAFSVGGRLGKIVVDDGEL